MSSSLISQDTETRPSILEPGSPKPSISIFARTQFAAVHKWDGAPEGNILQYPHRHVFKVEVEVKIRHLNREIEFVEFQERLRDFCEGMFASKSSVAAPVILPLSCEAIAKAIWDWVDLLQLEAILVEVSEDGENGARLRA